MTDAELHPIRCYLDTVIHLARTTDVDSDALARKAAAELSTAIERAVTPELDRQARRAHANRARRPRGAVSIQEHIRQRWQGPGGER